MRLNNFNYNFKSFSSSNLDTKTQDSKRDKIMMSNGANEYQSSYISEFDKNVEQQSIADVLSDVLNDFLESIKTLFGNNISSRDESVKDDSIEIGDSVDKAKSETSNQVENNTGKVKTKLDYVDSADSKGGYGMTFVNKSNLSYTEEEPIKKAGNVKISDYYEDDSNESASPRMPWAWDSTLKIALNYEPYEVQNTNDGKTCYFNIDGKDYELVYANGAISLNGEPVNENLPQEVLDKIAQWT